jgi:hypothetical protein
MFKKFRRRTVKTDDQMTTYSGAKALLYQYASQDSRVAVLAESYQRLLDERADVVLHERHRLYLLLLENRGVCGPDDWGRGYYEGADDSADIVSKGE